MRRIALVLCTAAALTLVTCGGDDDEEPAPQPAAQETTPEPAATTEMEATETTSEDDPYARPENEDELLEQAREDCAADSVEDLAGEFGSDASDPLSVAQAYAADAPERSREPVEAACIDGMAEREAGE